MNSVLLYDSKITSQSLIQTFKDFVPFTDNYPACDILFRWGNPNETDERANIVLNRNIPLKNSLDKEKAFEILKINKIRRPRFVIPRPESQYPIVGKYFNLTTNRMKEQILFSYPEAAKSGADFFVEYIDLIKKYHVYIFDLSVFSLTKRVAVKTHGAQAGTVWEYEEVPQDLDQDAQKICHLAQRAVYVLGLDFCMIHAGIDVRGRPVILDISPTPSLSPFMMRQLHQKVKEYASTNLRLVLSPQSLEQSTPSDPGVEQLTLFSDNPAERSNSFPAVDPTRYLKRHSEVLLGADPEFMLRDSFTGKLVYPSKYVNREGELGYDERSEQRQGLLFPLAEVRPEPQYCPVKLTNAIQEILEIAAGIFPAHLEWLAGSLQFEQYQVGGHIHFSNIKLNNALMRALDNYLGIPVFLIENPLTSSKRRRQYGWIGSFRVKPHGGFEYRTPGSWLVSPEITRACLCLAKIVASEYPVLNRDYFTDCELQKAFYQAKKLYFYDIFNDIWNDIIKTSLFREYEAYLTPIIKLIETKSHWNEDEDLRKAWGLLPSELHN